MDDENRVGVDVGVDKASDEARLTRTTVVADAAPKTDAYTKDAAFKGTVDRYLATGVSLNDAVTTEATLRAQLKKATSEKNVARKNHDKAHALLVSNVQDRSTTPADVRSYGFEASKHTPRSTGIISPEGLTVTLDKKTGRVTIKVKLSKRRPVQIEMSPDPITATSFKVLDGAAARRTIDPPAPGTYWFRAAVLGTTGKSEYTVPVQLVIH